MSNILFQTIDQISREKGIDPQVVVEAIEDAIVVASRKYFKTDEELRSRINPDSGEIEVFAVRKVVEDVEDDTREISLAEARTFRDNVQVEDELEFPKPTEGLGRIAAQMAKQVIFQKVREAERESVYAEYHEHVGEIVNCIVKRFESGDIIVELGKTEGRLPRREQSRLESFTVGDRIRVVIIRVEKTTRGPQVIVSRADPLLVQHLFQTEVPEIYDGTVQIRSIAREAGERTKIAVTSRERDVDPVGACVGMKGSRVQSIIRELRGEKIDIIQWSDDIVSFATNAISPAKVSRVTMLDAPDINSPMGAVPEEERTLEIVVEDSQLSLAIGKKGQNVRLASRLIGWRIDIKSEEEKRAEIEDQIERMRAATPLEKIEGLTAGIIKKLVSADITTVEQLADLAPEDLQNVPGIGGKTIDKIRDELSEYYATLTTWQDDLERSTERQMFGPSPEPDTDEAAVASDAAGDEAGVAGPGGEAAGAEGTPPDETASTAAATEPIASEDPIGPEDPIKSEDPISSEDPVSPAMAFPNSQDSTAQEEPAAAERAAEEQTEEEPR
jgi:transcription termination/antitermination protein NusA